MLNHYETVIIFSPLLYADDVKREVSRYTKMVTDGGATILEERQWGLRQLAYPIEGKSNGLYYIMEFAGPGTLHQKLEIEFKRDDNIMRWLTIKLTSMALSITINAERAWWARRRNPLRKRKMLLEPLQSLLKPNPKSWQSEIVKTSSTSPVKR